MKPDKFIITILILFISFFGLTLTVSDCIFAKFFKYVDENGVVHFVDDKGKIPEQFSSQAKSYKENKDYLTPKQIKALEEKPREAELEKTRQDMLQKERRKRKEFEKKRQEVFNRLEDHLKKLENQRNTALSNGETGDKPAENETPVRISGNTIFVPVIIGYERNEIKADLVLDTGANIVALHHDIASPLRIHEYERAQARVVGGDMISAKLVRLSYIKVGPHTQESVSALILENDSSRSGYDGLLGANFLFNYQYSVDYKKSVIRWQ